MNYEQFSIRQAVRSIDCHFYFLATIEPPALEPTYQSTSVELCTEGLMTLNLLRLEKLRKGTNSMYQTEAISRGLGTGLCYQELDGCFPTCSDVGGRP